MPSRSLSRSPRLAGSSPTVGSSISSTRGSCISARTSSTRRRLPPLSVAGLVAGAILEREPRKLVVDTRLRGRARHAVQAGMEHQVGGDRQLEIEGRLLEHDAELGQCRHRIARHVVAHDLDAAGVGDEQAGEQLEQRRLAGAVRAEQRDELARLYLEADAIERPHRTVALGDVVDEQGRAALSARVHRIPSLRRGAARLAPPVCSGVRWQQRKQCASGRERCSRGVASPCGGHHDRSPAITGRSPGTCIEKSRAQGGRDLLDRGARADELHAVATLGRSALGHGPRQHRTTIAERT